MARGIRGSEKFIVGREGWQLIYLFLKNKKPPVRWLASVSREFLFSAYHPVMGAGGGIRGQLP